MAPDSSRVRVAAAQYFIRPIARFEQFADQVTAVVCTAAASYGCRLLVLPEYFTAQLMALDDPHQPIGALVRGMTRHREAYLDLLSGLARQHGLYIVGGTFPTPDGDRVYNDAYLFAPSGEVGVQGKLHMTRFERESWDVAGRDRLKVFETDFGRLTIAICYDVEFPEVVRAAAQAAAHLLCVPSSTDDRHGFLRVRYCAHARAIENQMFVLHAPTVGGLPRVPDLSLNYGTAAILTPCDFPFARDGVLAEGVLGQEHVVVGELDLSLIEESRTFGTVLPLRDSQHSRELAATVEVEVL